MDSKAVVSNFLRATYMRCIHAEESTHMRQNTAPTIGGNVVADRDEKEKNFE